MDPVFFPAAADFRGWLEENHQSADEVLVGYYKKKAGKPSMTWSESVDQALCFGWIDGKRMSLGEEAHTIRFTPRRPKSNWSSINIAKVAKLTEEGLMRPAGVAAFEKREEARSGVYSYEQRQLAALTESQEAEFRANPAAWEWFQAAAPSYRRTAMFWVTTAKREETVAKRLKQLIDDSAAGLEVPPLRRR